MSTSTKGKTLPLKMYGDPKCLRAAFAKVSYEFDNFWFVVCGWPYIYDLLMLLLGYDSP